MISISKNDPILKIEGLKTKIDETKVSNSLVTLLGNYEEALIVQQLHSWRLQGGGVILDGIHWFDKSAKEWSEALPDISQGKINVLLKTLADQGILKREQLYQKHHGHNYGPRNRTYYYRLDYDKLYKLAEEF